MDINKVYEVDIYEITSILIAKGVVAKTQAKFIKRTVIYKNEEGYYADLFTDEVYIVGEEHCKHSGDKFVNVKKSVVLITDIINYKKNEISKKKLIRKYNREKVK